MKQKFLITVLILIFGSVAGAKEFGLGVVLGGPTGVSGNYYLTKDTSIDGALGAGLGDRDLHFHSTYLIHFKESITADNYKFGWYFGGGARFASRDADDDDNTRFGPRGSAGLNFPIKGNSKYTFDAFAEMALNLSVVSKFDTDIDFAIGGRCYF